MKFRRLTLIGLAAAAAGTGGGAWAADDSGAIYIAPLAQYFDLGGNRHAKDGFGYQLGLGYDFTSGWAGELALGNGSFNTKPASGKNVKLTSATADVLYRFLPDSTVRPYVLAGVGHIDDQLGGDNKLGTALAEGGVGLLTGLGDQTGSTRLLLRTEAKYRREFIDTTTYGARDPSDVVFGVGLQVLFGAPTPAPMVARAVEVIPPPPPPPPPVPMDSDHDGVPDSMDKCPNTPPGDKVDVNGCTIRDEIKLEGVNFATDSAVLVPESDYVLGYAVATLKKYPSIVVEVQGHTDSRGSAQHNLILSQHRAESVMAYLKDHGVSNDMTARGYGKTRPIADNTTREGRLQNRRVTLKILSGLYQPEKH